MRSIREMVKMFVLEALLVFGGLALFSGSLYIAYELYTLGAIEYSPVEFVKVAFIVTTMAYGSLLFLSYKRFVIGRPTWCEYVSHEIDDHYRVCCLAGKKSNQVLDEYRRRGKPSFARSDYVSARERIEADLVMILLFLLVAAIGFFLTRLPDHNLQILGQTTLLMAGVYIVMALYSPIYTTVMEYKEWRIFWIGYWEFVRDMCAPINRLMDQQSIWFKLEREGSWGAVSDQDYRKYVRDVLKAAHKRHLKRKLAGQWTWPDVSRVEQFIDQMIWYDEMKEMTDELKLPANPDMDEFRIILEDLESMKELDTPDTFHYRYRGYRKLCSAHLFNEWFAIMTEVDAAIVEATNDQRKNIFEIASERLGSYRELPHVPIPASTKWIALLYALAIASSEYVAPILFLLF